MNARQAEFWTVTAYLNSSYEEMKLVRGTEMNSARNDSYSTQVQLSEPPHRPSIRTRDADQERGATKYCVAERNGDGEKQILGCAPDDNREKWASFRQEQRRRRYYARGPVPVGTFFKQARSPKGQARRQVLAEGRSVLRPYEYGRPILSEGRWLRAQVFVKKVGHEVVGLVGFGEVGIVPEGVGQGFEDYQLCIYAGSKIGTVEDSGAA